MEGEGGYDEYAADDKYHIEAKRTGPTRIYRGTVYIQSTTEE